MKKILFLLITLILSTLLYGETPKEVSTSDKNLKYENKTIMYNSTPYTGKIITNESDEQEGYEGYITLKNGHLDNMSEIKSTKGERFKFTVKNGAFNGEMIVKSTQEQVDGILFFENGIVKKINMKMPGTIINLTINRNNKFDGIMSSDGESFNFKNGVADYMGIKILFSVNPKTGDFELETKAGGQSNKEVMPSPFPTVKQFEEEVFSGFFE